ncbi:4-hydroxy-3-methylbut-2-enyl diphosphate reductase [Patescibacteria group bacterium]|nr:4-hydroxy-3-methylbut-2-enyl diphosphate reductase [Patescibacteria group bacterium]
MVFEVFVAKPRGFCGGVEMAVDLLEIVLEIYGPPIYMKHQIVHNDFIVQHFQEKGVIFVETVEEIPSGAVAVFSAHGSPPEDYEIAEAREIEVIDAVCPLVLKVHNEAIKYAKQKYTIIVVGHRDHIEPRGVLGRIPKLQRRFVETTEEAKAVQVPDPSRVVRLTQTTLSEDDVEDVTRVLRQRFPKLLEKKDICYATDNRQAAVKELAKKADLVLVVGSQESSNSNRLREVAKAYGAKEAHLIARANDIYVDWLKGVKTVLVTSGASTPEKLVKEVLDYLEKQGAGSIEELAVVEEDVSPFKFPEELVLKAEEKGLDVAQIRRTISELT